MANRQNFTRAVRNEIAERAKNALGIPHCEWCGATGVKRQLHHLKQDAMKSEEEKRKPLTAADGVLICQEICHKQESAEQAIVFNKNERIREKHNGVERRNLSSIPAPPSAKEKRAALPPSEKITALPRRRFYEDA